MFPILAKNLVSTNYGTFKMNDSKGKREVTITFSFPKLSLMGDTSYAIIKNITMIGGQVMYFPGYSLRIKYVRGQVVVTQPIWPDNPSGPTPSPWYVKMPPDFQTELDKLGIDLEIAPIEEKIIRIVY